MPKEEKEEKPKGVKEEDKALDLDKEMTPPESGELDDVVLLARDLTNTLIKTIKAFRLYPPENPSVIGFRDQVFRKFQQFLIKYHSFILKIEEYHLSFQDKIIYENTDLKTSIAFLLYKDGLRELRFMEGLEDWEIQGLIDIIRRSDNINQLEDDLVTLIWERDFIHISYVATDEFLEEVPVIIPENVDQFRKNLIFEPLAHQVEADLREEDIEGEIDYYEILSGKGEKPLPTITNRSLYFLTPDELEGLRKEVESEIAPTFVFNVIDILFEIMALENNHEPYQDAVNVLRKLLDALITLGEFQKASDLLTRVNIILNTYDLQDWQIKTIEQLIEDAGESQRIERIGRILEKGERIRLEDISSYLLHLKPNSIQPLIQVLGELSNSKARRMLCDVICEIGKNSVELIAPFMDDRRWYLVRNITYILGRIGKESSLPAIQKAFNHKEARVRREAVQAVGLLSGPKAFAQLIKALPDEDIRIRSMAALNLAKVGKGASVPHLLNVIQSKEFSKREPAEIKALFDAIGIAGSNDALPYLKKILEQKGWFGGGGREEIRQGAANALTMIGTPEAKSILEVGKNSKDESTRQACLRATKR